MGRIKTVVTNHLRKIRCFEAAPHWPPRKFFAPLEKCVGHNSKILDIVQKIWVPLRKLFAPPGVPSWLRACFEVALHKAAERNTAARKNLIN